MSSLVKNSALIGASRMLSRFLGLISTFIVARLLVPDDYAVIATCMLVQDFAMRLENIGFGQNIISKENLTPEFIGTLFRVRLFIGLILFVTIFNIAGFVGDFFENSQVESVLHLISFIFLLKPLTNIRIIIAVREKLFMPSIKIQVYSKIISVLATIALAILLENYWALAIGMVIGCVCNVVFSYIVTKPMWPTHFSLDEAKHIFSFSKWYLLIQIVEFTNVKANIFLVAKIFEKKLIGFFSLGSEICLMYSMEVANAIDKANLSELADKKRTSANFQKILTNNVSMNLAVKSLLLLPVYMVFIVYPEFVISILLGGNWLEMTPYFQLFAISSLIIGYASTFYNSLIVYRVPKLSFIVSVAMLLLRIPILYLSYIYMNPYILIIGGACLHLTRLLFFQALLAMKSKISFFTFSKFLLRESLFLLLCLVCYKIPMLFENQDLLNVSISVSLYFVSLVIISYSIPNSELSKLLISSKQSVKTLISSHLKK